MTGRRIAHLTTVDSSLRFLLHAQLVEGVRRGDEVLALSAPGPFVAEVERDGVRHVPLASSTRGMSLTADLRAAWELWRALRREPVDILHTHNPKPGVYGRIVGRLAGVPLVVNTNHGLYATELDPLPKRAAVLAAEAVAARFSDAELVQNPEDLAQLRRLRILSRRRSRLLGNGIDLARFDRRAQPPELREQARSELGVAPGTIVVGTVARLVAEKGLRELFHAARSLGPAYTLVVVGPEDPAKPDALDQVELEQARADGVRLLGHRTDVERLYAAMDVFVLASHREGFPRAAMEAAAMGLPIVASDVRGCRQVVVHGRNGLRVPVGDGDALARAVREIGEHPDVRRRMGVESRRLAEQHFDERDVVASVFEAYESGRHHHRGAALHHLRRRRRRGAAPVRLAPLPDHHEVGV